MEQPNSKTLTESSQKNCNNTYILGKILITDQNITFNPSEVINQINREMVNLISTFSVVVLANACFSFKFENEKDKEWVMDSRPWLLFQNQYLLLLKESCPNEPPSQMEFTTCPFWIRAYNIPHSVTNTEDLGLKIGQIIGYEVLEVERKRKRNNYLRIRVVVDVTKRLATGFWLCVSRDLDEVIWVSFKYEELPNICYRCGLIGHSVDSCINDDLANVPIDEKCIVNYIRLADSGAYEGADPSRVSADANALEEEGNETQRGYGPWLNELQGSDDDDDNDDDDDDDDDGGDDDDDDKKEEEDDDDDDEDDNEEEEEEEEEYEEEDDDGGDENQVSDEDGVYTGDDEEQDDFSSITSESTPSE